MAITTLSTQDRRVATAVLVEACSAHELQKFLSAQDTYLGFQDELLRLRDDQRAKRLATLSVLVLGDRLLGLSSVRQALCRAHHLPTPASWRPGTMSALTLCKSLGLPQIFAGRQSYSTTPPVERITSNPDLPHLLDYQEEVRQHLTALLSHPGNSALLSLPTGAGKTRVASQVACDLLAQSREQETTTLVWLAHTEELCEQAASCLARAWRSGRYAADVFLYRAWGRNRARFRQAELYADASADPNTTAYTFVVSTPLTLARLLNDRRLEGSLSLALRRVHLTVVDEAHRAAAPTYREALRALSSRSLLGLSATPVRETYRSNEYAGTLELRELFETLVEPVNSLGDSISPIDTLTERGVLARLRVARLEVPDKSLLTLAKVMRTAWQKTSGSTLAFTATASDAYVLAAYLTELGLRADAVTASSTSQDREFIVHALRRGQLDVVCNCEVLTTGFDAPSVHNIFLARHTNSPILYKQIIGRGLRGPLMGGGPSCNLYLCGITLPFAPDPATADFARAVWAYEAEH